MRINYLSFQGLVIQFEPHEVRVMERVLKAIKDEVGTPQARAVSNYFLELVEKETQYPLQ